MPFCVLKDVTRHLGFLSWFNQASAWLKALIYGSHDSFLKRMSSKQWLIKQHKWWRLLETHTCNTLLWQLLAVPCLQVSQPHDPLHSLYLLEIKTWWCHPNTASNQFLSMKKKIIIHIQLISSQKQLTIINKNILKLI